MSAVLAPPMPSVAPPPPARTQAVPRPLKWTVTQFHDLCERGYFEGRRASLIHGTIFEEGPMNPPHRIALELTDAAIRFAFGPGWRFCVQMPLVLGQSTQLLQEIGCGNTSRIRHSISEKVHEKNPPVSGRDSHSGGWSVNLWPVSSAAASILLARIRTGKPGANSGSRRWRCSQPDTLSEWGTVRPPRTISSLPRV